MLISRDPDLFTEDTSPEEIVPLPGIAEEESCGPTRHRASVSTLLSREAERELLQRNRDLSVTFGYGEGGSTADLRYLSELYHSSR